MPSKAMVKSRRATGPPCVGDDRGPQHVKKKASLAKGAKGDEKAAAQQLCGALQRNSRPVPAESLDCGGVLYYNNNYRQSIMHDPSLREENTMARHILENEFLKITVADAGAELISVWDKTANQERIWTGEPEVWNRHAPILFPFVGKVKDGKYRIGDKEYAMKTQHGFARDQEFVCVEKTDISVTHCLTATEQTRNIYPYEFRLTVCHKLLPGKELAIEWTIENPGEEKMFFSIGGHPGFMMPEGTRKEDCLISFPGKTALQYISANAAGYILPQKKTLPLSNGLAAWQADIPDTWIFEDHQVQSVGIARPDGTPFVSLHCDMFPMLAVWANPNGPFICLEPWFGRADDEGFTGTIDQKKDMQALNAGAKKDIAYCIEFH